MECQIWKRLPEHILEIIMAKLEVENLVRVRCLSKTWNSLVCSPGFTSLRSESHDTRPWLLIFNKQNHQNVTSTHKPEGRRICRAYDTFAQKWHLISLSFLPYHRHRPLQVLTASSQLILFSDSAHLILSNPLTKTWRRITPPINYLHNNQNRHANSPAVAIATLASDERIIMMVSYSRAAIYNSKSDRWNTNIDLAPRSNLRSEPVFCKGSFYFITWEAMEVVIYNVEQSAWRTIEAPALEFGRLVSCGGRVFVVGGIGSDGIAKTLCFWELLDDISTKWRQVDCAPEMVSNRVFSACYHSYEHIYCFGHGEFVCLSCISWAEVIMYSFSERTWHWVPACRALSSTASSRFGWASLEPTLNTVV